MSDDDVTDNKMLNRIKHIAENVATHLHAQTTIYSKSHFHLKDNNKPYHSPFVFVLFDEPGIDRQTNRDFLVAIQLILNQVEVIMFKNTQFNDILDILTPLKNVSMMLNNYIPKLVTNPSSFPWKPTEMSYEQLESAVDELKGKWPTPKSNGANTKELLINLTLIQQLAVTMTSLQHSAYSLNG